MRTIETMEPSTDSKVVDEHRLLRLYGELVAIMPSLRGRLVCAIGERSAATGITLAASLAGAASIVCDPDEAAVKAGLRRGHLDFAVRMLDEAVRIAKNEVRRARPVSVGLIADPAAVASEMRERGIVPDVLAVFSEQDAEAIGSKATVLLDAEQESPRFARLLAEHGWQSRTMPVVLLPELSDSLRANWLSGLPKYQRVRADGLRAVWLTDAEFSRVTERQP